MGLEELAVGKPSAATMVTAGLSKIYGGHFAERSVESASPKVGR
jgi:hypothetical protein